MPLPRPQAILVASAGVGAEQEPGGGVAPLAQQPPPATDAPPGKFGGVRGRPYGDQGASLGEGIGPGGNRLACPPVRDVVGEQPPGLPPRPPRPPRLGEGADELLLLRLHQPHRVPGAQERLPLGEAHSLRGAEHGRQGGRIRQRLRTQVLLPRPAAVPGPGGPPEGEFPGDPAVRIPGADAAQQFTHVGPLASPSSHGDHLQVRVGSRRGMADLAVHGQGDDSLFGGWLHVG